MGGDENFGRWDKEEVMKVKGGSGQCTIMNVARVGNLCALGIGFHSGMGQQGQK